MQEILEYVSKVTLGLLRPQAVTIEGADLHYKVSGLTDFYIDGVFVGQATLKNVSLFAGRSPYLYWEFAKMPKQLFKQIRRLPVTDRVLQVWVNDLPVATQNGHGVWYPYLADQDVQGVWHPHAWTAKEYADVSFGTDCFELKDERLQDLCRKYWHG